MSSVSERREFRLPELGEPISHYTDAVAFGDLLFVSGIVGYNAAEGTLAPDVVGQARQLFTNMSRILEEAGATFADILKVTVFLTDINDRTAINPIRTEVFGEHKPASTLVEVSKLALPQIKIEIEAVVGLPAQQ